ncbi:isoaspartyl peptidase [Chroococcidiopsis sp. CCALA 051]|uniref:isoaspartyl peptidase/L-asparaginase n=1 Tax=Chroococcidiopsis sp. CCALA 051 TaxID=869949 RepID=UPI000D0D23F3|nr:isoaspartyl peptidase/L-asparaginase [Chroococcidiopsis sp. CCALA 051]PSM50456.1 isoaspartyl peptidase [Chroococcidiopsis sp. CCALA 051]
MELDVQPKVIIHGGAGSSLHGKGGVEAVRRSLYPVIEDIYALLLEGKSACEAVVRGCQMLEDDPLFNAGTGSVLQSDGQIRMSAALMDGIAQRFSGTINVSRVQHPIELALYLQSSPDRVLSDFGAAELLRELQLPSYDPITERRLNEWLQERQENFTKTMAAVVAEVGVGDDADTAVVDTSARRGTIGVVVLDSQGKLASGTSTGGKGFERIGRVSDSAMPAGNYATAHAAVSCTGIGEDIIDECLAARIVVRVTDGMSLLDAMQRTFTEASDRQRDLGAIALDASGAIAWGKTSDVILAAFHNGDRIGDTLELPVGTQVGCV